MQGALAETPATPEQEKPAAENVEAAPTQAAAPTASRGGRTPNHRAEGATTPLTGYGVDLAGPFGDADPSVHM